MSNPTAVFLKCGSISFTAGLAIWLLLLQLHDKTSKTNTQLDPAHPSSEHSDIIKELEVELALPKPAATPGPNGLKQPGATASLAQEKPTPLDSNPRDEHAMPASAEIRSGLLETRTRQTFAEPKIALAPAPPPAEARIRSAGLTDAVSTGAWQSPDTLVGAGPREPQSKPGKSASPQPPLPLPAPPLPERHPLRLATKVEPRPIQAITQRQTPRKPGLTWDGALSFLTNLWRSPEPAARPVFHGRACDDAAGAAPATPCSRVGTRLLRR